MCRETKKLKECQDAINFLKEPLSKDILEKEWEARMALVEKINLMRDAWNPQEEPNEKNKKWCREASVVLNADFNFLSVSPKELPNPYRDVARAARRIANI